MKPTLNGQIVSHLLHLFKNGIISLLLPSFYFAYNIDFNFNQFKAMFYKENAFRGFKKFHETIILVSFFLGLHQNYGFTLLMTQH